MASSGTYPERTHDGSIGQMYEFGGNPFLIWNAELGDFSAPDPTPWQFDYSTTQQLPQYQPATVLKHGVNPAEVKSPRSCDPLGGLNNSCPSERVHVQTPVISSTDDGLRIENMVSTSVQSPGRNSPIPAIITHSATRNNTVDETQIVGLPHSSHDTLSMPQADMAQYAYNITPPNMGYAPYSSTALQEPFQWHSPTTRRTSMSSIASGPIFSHMGTPVSTYTHEAVMATPHTFHQRRTPQSASSQQFAPWSPRSPSSAWKPPQSRKHSSSSLSRMSQQYIDALQKYRNPGGLSMTMPSRRKPKFEHCLSESELAQMDHSRSPGVVTKPPPGRRRAASAVQQRPHSAASIFTSSEQLQLPVFQPEHMFQSPMFVQSTFPTANTPSFTDSNQPNPTPYFGFTPYLSQEPLQQMALTPSPTFHTPERPSEPPASDFHNRPQDQLPIFQAPQFDGDIYTPQYKRRNGKGEWEGWCGLCQPGQWHNLKNSRYWDDKLRNHGICARTKQKFEDPTCVRIVDLEGKVVDLTPERDECGELRGDEWVVSGLDGSLRKREGLCGYCGDWVPMDGVRTKAKGKSVGWWSHAYKCHERGRKADRGEHPEHPSCNASQYLPQHDPQLSRFLPQHMYTPHQPWGRT